MTDVSSKLLQKTAREFSTEFSIVMPAYRSQDTIAQSVQSVLVDTHDLFEVLIVADDGEDYAAVLATQGIVDSRLKFLSTGAVGAGSSAARNVALDAATARYIAILDADDLFLDNKLAQISAAIVEHGFVSTALDVRDVDRGHLRNVGAGDDQILSPADYKFTNLSMDSMIAYDRNIIDPRYDESQDCLTDLDLVLKLFAGFDRCFHIGKPLHAYVKQLSSISMGAGASNRYTRMKHTMLERLKTNHYPMKDGAGPKGFSKFVSASLDAEQTFEAALLADPTLIFEDHLRAHLEN